MTHLTEIISTTGGLLGLAAISTIIRRNNRKFNDALHARLLNDYHKAIADGNEKKALNAGRVYYSSLRFNGRLTMPDEQLLTNDLPNVTTALV